LGRGSHYSVLRSVVWHNNLQRPLQKAAYLDLAIIWDEDHDTRIIEVVDLLYLSGLLTSVIFAGERKGSLTLLVSEQTFEESGEKKLSAYQKAVEEITQSLDDPWPAEVASLNSHSHSIINDDSGKISQYLKTINMLWQLGVKPVQ
jgi:hypothetical protein